MGAERRGKKMRMKETKFFRGPPRKSVRDQIKVFGNEREREREIMTGRHK